MCTIIIPYKMIALISAVPVEAGFIRSCLEKKCSRLAAGKTVITGSLYGRDVILMYSGIGKVNAAQAATYLLEKFPVRLLINFGIGGAYAGEGLAIGDVAIASSEILGDEGVASAHTIDGLKKIGIPLVQRGRKRYFNEFPLSLPRNPWRPERDNGRFAVKSGRFVTVSAVSGTPERAAELQKRFKSLCENMEGAAVAHVCALYGVTLHEVRGISNIAGVRDRRRWNIARAAHNCQKTVLGMIRPS